MTYRSDDIQQILQKALAKKQEGEFSREQLLEMASELGIPPEMLKSAEQEWQIQRGKEQKRQAFDRFRRQAFKANLISYIAVNVFLVVINLLTSPRHFWAIYPILGWGLGLFFHGWATYRTAGADYDQAFEQWKNYGNRGR